MQLACHGAKVHLGARGEIRAQQAIEKLCSEIPVLEKERIVWLPFDMSDLKSVVTAAKTICKTETKLDLLSTVTENLLRWNLY